MNGRVSMLRRGVGGILVMLVTLGWGTGLAAQDGPPPEERAAIDALLGMLGTPDRAGVERYVDAHAQPAWVEAEGRDALVEHMMEVREAARGTLGSISVELDPEGLLLMLRGQREAVLRVVFDADYRLTRLAVVSSGEAAAPADPRSAAVEDHLRAIEDLASVSPERFVSEHLEAGLRTSLGPGRIEEMTDRIRLAAGSASAVSVGPAEEGFVIEFRAGQLDLDVVLGVSDAPPYLIDALDVRTPTADAGADAETITWEGLEARLDAAAADLGFAGSVIAIRDGAPVLRRAWGEAGIADGRPNTMETIFDIGSIPIDFTRAAVLLLVQRGELDLDDPITRFFPDVPDDRAGMTVRHLLEHRSGLPNFHHRLDVDDDRDLSWIDRETAERRILAAPLLFEPGSDTSPSHSAFVLLAALVERVSGQPYVEMLRTNFFEPLGMASTGAYGEDLDQPLTRFAEGDGAVPFGAPNVPPRWGEASWLVMGSGGMVSTPDDYLRWISGLRDGRVLTGAALEAYLSRGSALGGTDRGFFFGHAWSGGDSMIILAANAGTNSDGFEALVRGLIALVERTDRPIGDG